MLARDLTYSSLVLIIENSIVMLSSDFFNIPNYLYEIQMFIFLIILSSSCFSSKIFPGESNDKAY